jgi:hypothetical protein
MSERFRRPPATLEHMSERERLRVLVQRILDGGFTTDEQLVRLVAEFEAKVLYPGASGLIFYWQDAFDQEPTAAEIVDRALNYRPIEL